MRPKYVRIADTQAAPIVAKLPEKLLERGILAPGLLAHIVIGKYADHLPLYRQEQIYLQRHGVGLSRQTMANGVALVAEWLKPVVEAMKAEEEAVREAARAASMAARQEREALAAAEKAVEVAEKVAAKEARRAAYLASVTDKPAP